MEFADGEAAVCTVVPYLRCHSACTVHAERRMFRTVIFASERSTATTATRWPSIRQGAAGASRWNVSSGASSIEAKIVVGISSNW